MFSEARRVVLDPLVVILYVAFFTAVTLMTMRRPSYGICILIVVQPFAFYQSTTAWLTRVALIAVVLGLLAYRDAFVPIGERAPWRIVAAGLLVLCATLVSFVHATYYDMAIREVLKLLEYIILFCAIVAAYRLDPDRHLVC